MSNSPTADLPASPLPSNLLGLAWTTLATRATLDRTTAAAFGFRWPAPPDWREQLGARIAANTGVVDVKPSPPKPKKAKKSGKDRTAERRQKRKHGAKGGKARKGDGFYSSREWKELRYKALAQMTRRCMCCGWEPRAGQGSLHVDHILPRSKFPDRALDLTNLQILCADCNQGKSNLSYEDWRGEWPEVEASPG